jgi:16S rRNA (guanine(966)-N(2))-methyltransferase RsmD
MLRVISGSAGGLKLKTIKGMTTRPTTDKVKGSIFNIIASRLEGACVLDLFAGTGSLGIEALSRGAEKAFFFDKSPECCKIIKENLAHTRLADRAEVFAADFAAGLGRLYAGGEKFDLVLLDPPYNKNFIQDTLKILMNNDIIRDDGILVAEHSISDSLPETCGRLEAVDSRKYGDTAITIYIARKKEQ